MKTGRNIESLAVAGALSAVLHLLLVGVLVLGLMPDLSRMARRIPPPSPARMRLVPPPPAVAKRTMPQAAPTQRFVDTTGLAQQKPIGPTPNISERDTALRSPKPGSGDVPLPTQAGVKKPGLTFFETPESREVKAEQPQPEQTPMQAEAKAQEAKKQGEARRPPEVGVMGLRPRPAEGERQPQEERKEAEARQGSERKQPQAAPFEFKQDRTAIEGGAAAPGDASIDSRATPLGEYQGRIYRAIGSQWRFMVRQQRGLMDLGTVAATFLVRKDGTLAELNIDYNTSSSAMLQTISENAIRMVAPFPPFPASVAEQVGPELPFDVKFTIY